MHPERITLALSASPIFVGLLLLLVTLLALNVSRHRSRTRVIFGDGEDKPLRAAIRAHGNAVEHALPLSLLLVVLEFAGAQRGTLLALGAAAVLARLLHAVGFTTRTHALSLPGVVLTYGLELGMSIWAVALGLR